MPSAPAPRVMVFKHKEACTTMKAHIRLLFLILFLGQPLVSFASSEPFINSFIDHYDFSVEGRYTHEYHTFLLEKARTSLDELKERLRLDGIHLAGRYVIAGYEGEAIPSYYTDYSRIKIDDEMSKKGHDGWSLRLHNQFGLLTGFLFKDVSALHTKKIPLEHIGAEHVEILQDESGTFQEHAFGETYPLLLESKRRIEKTLKKNNVDSFFGELIHFWNTLYNNESVLSGRQRAATQDILFAIEYAKYLRGQDVDLLSYYTGPDITYPIEISQRQPKEATRSAQQFVKVFSKDLKQVNGKKTVYMFSSFVDGVGKSTTLGNIKNWLKHGSDFEHYERVDNSSSQYAEVYEAAPGVFIADLPAQISHFTYKPDGFVYVDVETEATKSQTIALQNYIRASNERLADEYRALSKDVKATIARAGYNDSSLQSKAEPAKAFIRNLMLLKRLESNVWIPFTYENENYLFDKTESSKIRILHTLGNVASHGLKNIESEQMLFLHGVRFPFSYGYFLDDLMGKLKAQGVEELVFVDFNSMYPRSSRENVRINYLLQQLALLDPAFCADVNLYNNFVNASQLYADLMDEDKAQLLEESLCQETKLRLILYKIIEQHPNKTLDGWSVANLTAHVQAELKKLSGIPHFDEDLAQLIAKKFEHEQERLAELFGLSKEFINVTQFSFHEAKLFSDSLHKLFTSTITCPGLNELWEGLESPFATCEQGAAKKLENQLEVTERFLLNRRCKNAAELSLLFRFARASWYASILNLVNSRAVGGQIELVSELFKAPPFVLKYTQDGSQVSCVQKTLEPWSGAKQIVPFALSLGQGPFAWGDFKGKPYLLDWQAQSTTSGVYGYGNMNEGRSEYRAAMGKVIPTLKIVLEHQAENGSDSVLCTSSLFVRLKECDLFKDYLQRIATQAQKNGPYVYKKEGDKLAQNCLQIMNPYSGLPEQAPGVRLMLRALATLDMVVKDVNSDIVVRRGNKMDFKAALVLHQFITLPRLGVYFEKPLFENYDAVEPLISWDVLSK
jgi:hypothetical protein